MCKQLTQEQASAVLAESEQVIEVLAEWIDDDGACIETARVIVRARAKAKGEEAVKCAHKLTVSELKGHLIECMSMLNSVQYWDACPDTYKDRINKLQKIKQQAIGAGQIGEVE